MAKDNDHGTSDEVWITAFRSMTRTRRLRATMRPNLLLGLGRVEECQINLRCGQGRGRKSDMYADDYNYTEERGVTNGRCHGPTCSKTRYSVRVLDPKYTKRGAIREAYRFLEKANDNKKNDERPPLKKEIARKVSDTKKRARLTDNESELDLESTRRRKRERLGSTETSEDANQTVGSGKENRNPKEEDLYYPGSEDGEIKEVARPYRRTAQRVAPLVNRAQRVAKTMKGQSD